MTSAVRAHRTLQNPWMQLEVSFSSIWRCSETWEITCGLHALRCASERLQKGISSFCWTGSGPPKRTCCHIESNPLITNPWMIRANLYCTLFSCCHLNQPPPPSLFLLTRIWMKANMLVSQEQVKLPDQTPPDSLSRYCEKIVQEGRLLPQFSKGSTPRISLYHDVQPNPMLLGTQRYSATKITTIVSCRAGEATRGLFRRKRHSSHYRIKPQTLKYHFLQMFGRHR